MSVSKTLGAAFGALLLSATTSMAWESAGRAYPYAGVANHCPHGLSPVVVSGVISCGTPTVHRSYQSYKAQPGYARVKRVHKKRRHVRRVHTHVYIQPTYQTHSYSAW